MKPKQNVAGQDPSMEPFLLKWQAVKKNLKTSQQKTKASNGKPTGHPPKSALDWKQRAEVKRMTRIREFKERQKPQSMKALKRLRARQNKQAKKRLEWKESPVDLPKEDKKLRAKKKQPVDEQTSKKLKSQKSATKRQPQELCTTGANLSADFAKGTAIEQQKKTSESVGKEEHKENCCTVKVENLDNWVTRQELKNFFTKNCGVVDRLYLAKPTARSTWAYVTFLSHVSAKKALRFNGTKLSKDMQQCAGIHFARHERRYNEPRASESGVGSVKSAVLSTLPVSQADEELEKMLDEQRRRKKAKKRGVDPDRIVEPIPLKKPRKSGNPAARVSLDTAHYLTTLNSGTFRLLNSMFCTSSSTDARKFFDTSPDMFEKYHVGYREQVRKWPVNPLDIVIEELKKYKKGYPSSREAKKEEEVGQVDVDADERGGIPQHWQICDLGCGDARLALEMSPYKVHSFDLLAVNERVIVADIAHVPLESYSCEVAVLCLALLGTNFVDFLVEANRVLVNRGLLKVVEICSRIPLPEMFQQLMKPLGFKCLRTEKINDFFWIFDFSKHSEPEKDWKRLVEKLNPMEIVQPFKYKKR